MTTNKTLLIIASKLGLGDEEKVLSKAAEYERLLQTKSMAGSNITETSRTVICLNLAANALGIGLDIKSAIKYSGLKPLVYNNSRKVVENLLELNDDQLTVPILCASLQCNGVEELAERILEEYRKKAKVEIDLKLPQYVCMAVHQACRINKVKLSKSKVIEKSRLKAAQWAKLDAEWSKFVDEHFTVVAKKKGRPPKNAVEGNKEVKLNTEVIQKTEPEPENHVEAYEEWKRRMLDNAFKELAELKEKENDKDRAKAMTPRRSPRKTPQKFSPYKTAGSPNKTKGVRLLFPIES